MRRALLACSVRVLAGCGGHHAKKVAGRPPPALTTVCGTQPAGFRPHVSWVETSDGVRLYGASVGTGDRVVVLAHESGGQGLRGWPDLKGVDAVVSVSGELQLLGHHVDAIGNVGRLRVPLLVLASRMDGYLDAADARRLVRRAGSSDKSVVLYPGTLHGWDILNSRSEARRTLLAWLTQRLR